MECKDTILIKELDMSWLMTYAEEVKSEKLQQMRLRKSKRSHFDGGFSHAMSSGCHFQQGQGSSKSSPQRFDKDRVPTSKAQGLKGWHNFWAKCEEFIKAEVP